jgi:hypothetical protein
VFKFEGGRNLETLATFAREVRCAPWQHINSNPDARCL